MKPCRIYLVSTVQTSFWGSGERQYEKRFIPRMEQLAAELHFELTCQHEIVTSEAEARAAAEALAARIKDRTVTIRVKGGASGKLYGKVTAKDVADALGKLVGAEIDKKKVELPSVKEFGTVQAQVRLYAGVAAGFAVKVEPLA